MARRSWWSLFALGVSVVSLAGCSCDRGLPPGDEEDASVPGFDAATFRCTGWRDAPSEETISAAIEQIDVWEDGEITVPLDDLGCLRFERTIAGGQLVRSRIVDEIDVEYDLELGGFVPVVVTLAEWTRSADGVMHGRLQGDDEIASDDTFFEVEEIVGGDRLERVFRNPSSHEIEERLVIERRADGAYWQTRHERVEGVLTLVSETQVSDEHVQQDGGPEGGAACEVGDCDDATRERLSRLMREVVKRGFECLMNQGADRGDARARGLIAIGLMWNHQRSFQCASGGCDYLGMWCLECQLSGDVLQMTLKAGTRTDAEISSTIFHEIMHGAVGVHDEDAVQLVQQSGDTEYQMLRYTDPVYACTEFCFGTTYRNACSCAACIRVRTCHDLCASEPGCVARDFVTGEVVMSAAVGAACRTEGEPTTFHRTMAACRGACTGGLCRSYSRSCDPTCN